MLDAPVLDTHILLWWRVSPNELSKQQRQLLERCEHRGVPVAISAITIWEIAKLIQLKRLHLSRVESSLLESLERDPLLEILPITSAVAVESTRLGPQFHRDPADQLIVATARVHDRPLITADERIRDWAGVRII